MRRWGKGREVATVAACSPLLRLSVGRVRLPICALEESKQQTFIWKANDLVNQLMYHLKKFLIFEAVAASSCWNVAAKAFMEVVTLGKLSGEVGVVRGSCPPKLSPSKLSEGPVCRSCCLLFSCCQVTISRGGGRQDQHPLRHKSAHLVWPIFIPILIPISFM